MTTPATKAKAWRRGVSWPAFLATLSVSGMVCAWFVRAYVIIPHRIYYEGVVAMRQLYDASKLAMCVMETATMDFMQRELADMPEAERAKFARMIKEKQMPRSPRQCLLTRYGIRMNLAEQFELPFLTKETVYYTMKMVDSALKRAGDPVSIFTDTFYSKLCKNCPSNASL